MDCIDFDVWKKRVLGLITHSLEKHIQLKFHQIQNDFNPKIWTYELLDIDITTLHYVIHFLNYFELKIGLSKSVTLQVKPVHVATGHLCCCVSKISSLFI